MMIQNPAAPGTMYLVKFDGFRSLRKPSISYDSSLTYSVQLVHYPGRDVLCLACFPGPRMLLNLKKSYLIRAMPLCLGPWAFGSAPGDLSILCLLPGTLASVFDLRSRIYRNAYVDNRFGMKLRRFHTSKSHQLREQHVVFSLAAAHFFRRFILG